VLGKYIISDKPMSEEQWARERADVIDVEPRRFPSSISQRANDVISVVYVELPAVSAISNKTASFVLCAGNATAPRDRSGLAGDDNSQLQPEDEAWLAWARETVQQDPVKIALIKHMARLLQSSSVEA
jgi:hypothetical protein